MKRYIAIVLVLGLLTGCAASETAPATAPDLAVQTEQTTQVGYESNFSSETLITLSDDGIKTNALSVFASQDIVYYEDRDAYESGNPYGEGTDADKHTAEEAERHIVVNITEPGAYRVTGKLSAGQIRVDLGEDAREDESAVVELILDNADITCTVAPAILFLNVYECDGDRTEETATPEVDTAAAGANLILEGQNRVSGSYVAKIFKDKKKEKKLWKQDGAIYSYMSMNISGSGALELNAENEGIDTEMHLTINGGDIVIRSGNDGINTNEDNLSVTTINGGNVRIMAGLGAEGDGIDSNGYLVINGGKVISAAHPASDAGLDSSLGSYINGGTVIALGSAMDWAESESGQVTMNLQFASQRAASDDIAITREDGAEVFSFDPAAAFGENARPYSGAIISCPDFRQGDTCYVHVGGKQMQFTGTDVMRHPGGFGGGFGGERPDNAPPEGFGGERPEDFDGPPADLPDGPPPAGFPGGFGEAHQPAGAGDTRFYMQDMVNFFSGLTETE